MKRVQPVVSHLVKKHGTNNPYEIATQRNITVLHENLGSTLGFFFTYKRMRFIHIHNDISEQLQRFVCAHELGHALLHPKANTPFMRRNTFFSVDRLEKEANKFAIFLLTHESDVKEGETKEQYCARNEIPTEMVSYL